MGTDVGGDRRGHGSMEREWGEVCSPLYILYVLLTSHSNMDNFELRFQSLKVTPAIKCKEIKSYTVDLACDFDSFPNF